MDYRRPTLAVYDAHANIFEAKFGDHFALFKDRFVAPFLKRLSGKRILDLGAGPGHHAVYFREQGCDVLCIDASRAMVDACRAKGLSARQGLIEELANDLAGEQFDGVWAYASLLHLPKHVVPKAVEDIASMLPAGGIFGITVKQGMGEGFESLDRDKYGEERFFSLFTEDELRSLLAPWFDVVELQATDVLGKYVFLNAVAIRR